MEIGPIRFLIFGHWARVVGELIGRNTVNLIVGCCGRFLFFVVPRYAASNKTMALFSVYKVEVANMRTVGFLQMIS